MQSMYGAPLIDGDRAIRITTGGGGDGLFIFNTMQPSNWNVWGAVTVSAWIYVVSGQMGLHIGSNPTGFVAAPTTDDARLPKVLTNTSGFVYYVSITGITGAAAPDTTQVATAVDRIKRHTDLQQRRRHHEDDQQHQHHVDERRDVDLRHWRMPPGPASPTGVLVVCFDACAHALLPVSP